MHRIASWVIGIVLLWLPLGFGCGHQDDTQKALVSDDRQNAAYETHIVCRGDTLKYMDQSLFENYNTIIIGAQNLPHLEPRYLSKAVLYFNPWGNSRYEDDLPWIDWKLYQRAPAALGEPDVVLGPAVHCYRFDNDHVSDFLGWIKDFLVDYDGGVKGVFLDDFGVERSWWVGADSLKDLVWGPADGYPGWREDLTHWNEARIHAIEAEAQALVSTYCGPSGIVIVNGTARTLDGVRRFAEDVGRPCCESWEHLLDPTDYRYARPGDFLQVNGVGASGQWGDWSETAAGNGWVNLVQAAGLSIEKRLSVGLAYGVEPVGGGTIYQLYWDPGDSDHNWPLYYDHVPGGDF